ncbi:mannitol dehydrogenase [Tripterygium wilfordii]|uniref:Mannitol dehydrogenase n=1 Tax=Tripterygium wilfordii TaxID=458696 RepID=A0A7J7DTV1_TRIWF|nr:mannitol dehydrogenase [Tripterygium wilfordii]
MGTMDGIIDTVFAMHPLLPLIGLLKSHGKLVMERTKEGCSAGLFTTRFHSTRHHTKQNQKLISKTKKPTDFK